MTSHRGRYGPHDPDATYVGHALPEQLADLGEVRMDYATTGDAASPALLDALRANTERLFPRLGRA